MLTFQMEDFSGGRLCFSPDGRFIAIGCRGGLMLIDTVGKTARSLSEVAGHLGGYAFVRGGTAIAHIQYREGEIVVRNLTTGALQKSHLRGECWQSITADLRGDTFFASSRPPGESTLWRINAETPRQRTPFGGTNCRADRLAVSADGRWLAGQRDKAFEVWHVGGVRLPKAESIHLRTDGAHHDFALSADGASLIAVGGSGVRVWNTSYGKYKTHFNAHEGTVTAVACDPTKPGFITGDNVGQVFLWDFTGRVLTRYDWKLGEIYSLAFAPDGLRAAAVDHSGKLVVWDVDV